LKNESRSLLKSGQLTLGEFADPNPAALIESLRAFGYDLRTSIADLIDNSISAGAENVWVDFFWNGELSTISILDDGGGMSKEELINAMRPGSSSPLDVRNPDDLGRFGLGLKTASFSQCRTLIVASKCQNEPVEARCWDLDHVVLENKWQLLIPENFGLSEECTGLKKLDSGTLVIWKNMDRITGGMKTDSKRDMKAFHGMIDGVCEHLAMTFHRFMEGKNRFHIFVNNNEIEPWDPFLTKHSATQDITDENWSVMEEIVRVDPFILPHHSRLTSDEHSKAAGPKGWNAQQGFYIYRNKRLLVPGSWLNLGFKKEEHCKLGRILIDIPNTLDSEWQIDVKKAIARPPPAIKDELKRIATHTRSRASEIYRQRGKMVSRNFSPEYVLMWNQVRKGGKVFYKINRDHPLVHKLTANNQSDSEEVKTLLRLIEETVPVQLIAMANSEKPDSVPPPFEGATSEEMEKHTRLMFELMLNGGDSPEKAAEKIRIMDGFRERDELVEKILSELMSSN